MESATQTSPIAGRWRAGARARAALAVAGDYLSLTKPRIISLLLLTTVATMIVARPSGLAVSTVLWTMLGDRKSVV